MSRLVAFGCSYTYGHGLVDCHIEPNTYGPLPSKFAWPQLLADMLGIEAVNLGKPGLSNLHILWKLLNFQFKTDDLCIVMWTHFGRLPYSNLKYDSSDIDWNYYDNSVIKQLPQIEEENIVINNYIAMHHAWLHLSIKNIKNYFVVAPKDIKFYKAPDISIPSLITKNPILLKEIDKGLDKMHPGPKTHEVIAKYLFNQINTPSL